MESLLTQIASYGPPGIIIAVLLFVIRHLFNLLDEARREQIEMATKFGDALDRATESIEANNRLLLTLQAARIEVMPSQLRGGL